MQAYANRYALIHLSMYAALQSLAERSSAKIRRRQPNNDCCCWHDIWAEQVRAAGKPPSLLPDSHTAPTAAPVAAGRPLMLMLAAHNRFPLCRRSSLRCQLPSTRLPWVSVRRLHVSFHFTMLQFWKQLNFMGWRSKDYGFTIIVGAMAFISSRKYALGLKNVQILSLCINLMFYALVVEDLSSSASSSHRIS